jgi:hypothetical protein
VRTCLIIFTWINFHFLLLTYVGGGVGFGGFVNRSEISIPLISKVIYTQLLLIDTHVRGLFLIGLGSK